MKEIQLVRTFDFKACFESVKDKVKKKILTTQAALTTNILNGI